MTRTGKRRWPVLVVVLAALACAATWGAGQVRSMRDRTEVAKMTDSMKTICVGRFLVDVPAQAEVRLLRERIAGFDIDMVEETDGGFRARMAAREAAIRAGGAGSGDAGGTDGPHGPDGDGGMVEARDLRVPGMAGRTFIHGRSRTHRMEGERRIPLDSVTVEAHAHLGGYSFSLTARYTDEDSAAQAESLLARLRLRADGEVPAVPGFCIRHAIFVEPLPDHATEHVAMQMGLAGHPDLAVGLSSMPGGGAGADLLERVAEADAQAAEELQHVSRLRAGKRAINGLAGEEVLERIRELNATTGYGFMWEMRGAEHDHLQPYLLFELETGTNPRPGGQPVDSSLHEDAVLALWERISATIRLRPVEPAGAQAHAAREDGDPPAAALGTLARAGATCPQSGWWRCSDGGSGLRVQGGAVQYLRKGETMPQALLLPRRTLWQALRGVQPGVAGAGPTLWKLVDKRHRPRTAAIVALAAAGVPPVPVDGDGGAGAAIPLGTTLRTGDACPASGWWRCEEPQALDGTRWFPRGSLLPAATFQVPAGRFGGAAGPDVIQRRSTWQLVRHARAERPEPPETA